MRHIFQFSSLVFSALTLAAGCSAGPDDGHGPAPAPGSVVGLVSVTVGHKGSDGKPITNQYWATPAEVSRARAARQTGGDDVIHPARIAYPSSVTGTGPENVAQASAAISQVTCASGDFWLYDQTSCSGDVICFDGAGSADLTTYHYWWCPYNCYWVAWSNMEASFESGSRSGYIENTTWGVYQSFNTNQACTNTSTQPMQDLTLY